MISTGGIFMSSTDSFRYQIVTKFLNGLISRNEASILLQISERSVSRIASKIRQKGIFGVKHGNNGKSPSNKYSDDLKESTVNLLQTKYFDFNVKHFSEILRTNHDIQIPYKTIWRWCKDLKLVKNPRIKRRKKREYRHRLPSEGLLLQMDGCHHKFNGKDEWCLIAAIDDATSDIPYAEFFDGETTQGCLKVLKHIIERKGLPKAIYTDRAGWAGGGKRVNFSQFKRACDELGIQIIFANSPEGKGRIERAFRTIQDRLIPELRINKIKTLPEANNYVQNKFLPDYWRKEKTVIPDNPAPSYTPANPYIDLEMILTVQESRILSRDQTVSWQGERYKVVGSKISYGSYEAIFKTDYNDKTRVFIMDQEVFLEKIPDVIRPDMQTQKEATLDVDADLYRSMWRCIGETGRAVNLHRITGKPLDLSTPKKKAS